MIRQSASSSTAFPLDTVGRQAVIRPSTETVSRSDAWPRTNPSCAKNAAGKRARFPPRRRAGAPILPPLPPYPPLPPPPSPAPDPPAPCPAPLTPAAPAERSLPDVGASVSETGNGDGSGTGGVGSRIGAGLARRLAAPAGSRGADRAAAGGGGWSDGGGGAIISNRLTVAIAALRT